MLTIKEKRLYLLLTLLVLGYCLSVLAKPPLVYLALAEKPGAAKINLNTATLAELETVNGIGPALAKQLGEKRQELKGFQNWEQVLNLKGIGQQKLAKLREKFYLE